MRCCRVEERDVSMFIGRGCEGSLVDELREASKKFGIGVCERVCDAAYFVFDEGTRTLTDKKHELCDVMDVYLCEAFLLGKYFVSPVFYTRLLHSNQFSVALMQPESRVIPCESWLPRRGRLDLLRGSFEGINELVVIRGEGRIQQLKEEIALMVSRLLGIKFLLLADQNECNARQFAFNQLLIVCATEPDPRIVCAVRAVRFEAVLEAIVSNNLKAIDMETIYPPRVIETVEPVKSQPGPIPVELGQMTDQVSLTSLLPCPVDFLRRPDKKQKFIKCHPKHHRPGTIPALIGPDQLKAPSQVATMPVVASSKRRILVKDSWLAEDDVLLVNDNSEGEYGGDNNTTNTINTMNTRNTISTRNINVVSNNEIESKLIQKVPISTTTQSTHSTHSTPISPIKTSATTKFQSSFFKNLSKKS